MSSIRIKKDKINPIQKEEFLEIIKRINSINPRSPTIKLELNIISWFKNLEGEYKKIQTDYFIITTNVITYMHIFNEYLKVSMTMDENALNVTCIEIFKIKRNKKLFLFYKHMLELFKSNINTIDIIRSELFIFNIYNYSNNFFKTNPINIIYVLCLLDYKFDKFVKTYNYIKF